MERSEQNSRTKYQQYDETINEKNQEIDALRNDVELMRTNMQELEQSQKENREFCDTLQSEKATLTEKLHALEELVAKTPVEKDDVLQSGVKNSLTENHSDMDQRSAGALDDDKVGDDRIKHLEDILKGKEETIEQLVAKKEEADIKSSAEISRLQKEVESLGTELEESGKELMKMQLEHEAKITSLSAQCDEKLTKTVSEFRQSYEQEKEAIKNETDATNKVYQQKTVHFETLNSDLAKEMESVKSELLKTVKEKDILIENLKSRHDELSEAHRTLQNSFKSMKNSLENEKSTYDSQIQSQDDEKNELQTECASLRTMLDKAKSAELSLTNEVSSLKLEIDKRYREINDLRKSQKFSTQKESEQNAKLAEMLLETERLKTELANSSNDQM